MNDATTPPSKPAKPTKPAASKEKKEPTVRRSKFADIYPDSAKITVLAEKNPKKEGSAANARFEYYKDCATIKDFIAKAGNSGYSDIAYNVGRMFISVTRDPEAEAAAAKLAEEAAAEAVAKKAAADKVKEDAKAAKAAAKDAAKAAPAAEAAA